MSKEMRALGRMGSLGLILALVGCGAEPALEEEEMVPGLAGSWRMSRLAASSDAAEPADLIALGGAGWLTFDPDGRFVLTEQQPGDARRIAQVGAWRPLSSDAIRLEGDDGSPPQTFNVVVSGTALQLSGASLMDLDGDGAQETATIDAQLFREPDKLAEGTGIVGAWVRSDGRIRTYRLDVPGAAAARDRAALILAFHGGDGSGTQMQRIAGLDALVGEAAVVVAYPDAVAGQWAIGCNCTPADRQGIPDVLFVETLIDQLSAELPIDPGRVYATGFSQGGMLASRLACEIPERVAAIVTVGGAMSRVLAEGCAPSRPVPVVAFHGTADPSVPYEGDQTMLGAEESLAFWAAVEGCPDAAVESLADLSVDGTLVSRTLHAPCVAGSEVALYTIEGGGHTWPGSSATFPSELGLVSHDVSASQLLLELFARHPPGP